MEYPAKEKNGLKLLNLGCGNHYHLDWTNVDFGSRGTEVIGHNLLQGVPFSTATFDAVYHSHVLEHFTEADGKRFVAECVRVLKPGGVLRIAVPDLEGIVRQYITNLDQALAGEPGAAERRAWSVIELYDQVLRTTKGGNMGPVADAASARLKEYIVSRHGYEIKERWEPAKATQRTTLKNDPDWRRALGKLHKKLVAGIVSVFGGADMRAAFDAGMFRYSGELHLHMYDQYSLGELLRSLGLKDIQVCTATASRIPGFESFQLDTIGSEVRKPDSLFMEGIK